MIRNRVLVAGIVFSILFLSIIFILISDQNHLFPITGNLNSSDQHGISGTVRPVPDEPGNHSFLPVAEKNTPIISWITGTGVVVFHDMEGGFFGVESDDGRLFIPRNLSEKFRVNGTHVAFSFRMVEGTLSSYMWGEPVDVVSMTILSPGNTVYRPYPLVEYERAGGVTGAYESMTIYPDGKGEVSKWNLIEEISLDQDDIDNLTRATNISGFTDLKSEYLPSSPVPDAITYTITLQNKSVKTTMNEVPLEIKPLLSMLNRILDKNSISPVRANMTLEGTSWRLSSYIRTDGIPVILPHNFHTSAIFEKGNHINGSTGCSPYSTSYNQSGTNLSFGPVRMTRTACMEPGAGDVESAYVDLLGKVSMVSGLQQKLIMADANNVTLLVFDQAQTSPVVP